MLASYNRESHHIVILLAIDIIDMWGDVPFCFAAGSKCCSEFDNLLLFPNVCTPSVVANAGNTGLCCPITPDPEMAAEKMVK